MIPLIHSRRRAPVYLCAEDVITSPDWPVPSSIACDVNLSGFPREEVLNFVVHYGPKTPFGGVFLIQWLTGKIIYIMGGDSAGASELAYRIAFLFVAILLFISLIIYLFSSEKKKHF